MLDNRYKRLDYGNISQRNFLLMLMICFTFSFSAQKSILKGNSWNLNLQYSKSISKEFGFNVGRTYGVYSGGCAGFAVKTFSYGVGYSKLFLDETTNALYKAYIDAGAFTSLLLLSPILRLEYNYQPSNNLNFLKPEIGLHFVFFDVTYSHAFNINKSLNPIRHGFNLRLRLYHNVKNWDNNSYRFNSDIKAYD